MVVENVAGIGFTSRRPPEQQGNLTVSDGLLGEVIVDDQGILSPVAEIFADTAAGIGGDVLQGGGVAGAGGDDAGIGHGVVLLQILDHLGDGRFLLADGDVDALHAGVLLTDDRIDADRGLADLAVADDQFALAAADGRHRVDRLQAGVHRLVNRLALDHAGRNHFYSAGTLWSQWDPCRPGGRPWRR